MVFGVLVLYRSRPVQIFSAYVLILGLFSFPPNHPNISFTWFLLEKQLVISHRQMMEELEDNA